MSFLIQLDGQLEIWDRDWMSSKPQRLILCPLRHELAALRKALEPEHTFVPRNHGKMAGFYCDSLRSFFAVGGVGKAELALRAQYLVDQHPGLESLILAGVAGSLGAEIHPGDLVVASEVVEHDYKALFFKKAAPRYKVCADWLYKCRDQNFEHFRIHYGTLLSGDEDIIHSTRAAQLRAEHGGFAVAWESAGAARVARFNKLRFLEVRGISDCCDGETAVDFKTSLPVAMGHVAELLSSILQSTKIAGVESRLRSTSAAEPSS